MPKIKRLFVDTETTGTYPKVNAIHQLSGYIEIDDIIVESFDFKIKPFHGSIVNSESLNVAKVSLEDIMNYPPEIETYVEFKNILARHCDQFDKTDKFTLVGYNIDFDKDFLHEMFIRQDDKFFFSYIGGVIDVMVLATNRLEYVRNQMEDFKLVTVCKFFEFKIDESKLHDSSYDIFLTRELFNILKYNSIEQEIYNNIEIGSLKKFWDLIYPNIINTDYDRKCVVSLVPGKSLEGLAGIGNYHELSVVWENPDNYDDYYFQENEPPPPDEHEAEQREMDEIAFQEMLEHDRIENEKQRKFEDAMFEQQKIEAESLVEEQKIGNLFIEQKIRNDKTINKTLSELFLKPTENMEIKYQKAPDSVIQDLPKVIKITSEDYKMGFGKHAGDTIRYILTVDASYIEWLHVNHIKGIFVSDEIMKKAYELKEKQTKAFHQRNFKPKQEFGKLDKIDDDFNPFDQNLQNDLPF